jgi:hypothetical protein
MGLGVSYRLDVEAVTVGWSSEKVVWICEC